jgi:hypothetical protein
VLFYSQIDLSAKYSLTRNKLCKFISFSYINVIELKLIAYLLTSNQCCR